MKGSGYWTPAAATQLLQQQLQDATQFDRVLTPEPYPTFCTQVTRQTAIGHMTFAPTTQGIRTRLLFAENLVSQRQ